MTLGRKRIANGAAFVVLAGLAGAARAQSADFSGQWSVSGHIITSAGYMLVSPICMFQQTGDQVVGTCKGPNGAGSAVGLADGPNLSWQWKVVATNSIGLTGLASFNGALGADNVIRGSWTFSKGLKAVGQFTAQRL